MVDELAGVSDCFEHMLSQYLEAHSTLVEGLDRLETSRSWCWTDDRIAGEREINMESIRGSMGW